MDFHPITRLSDRQVEELHTLYQGEFWSKGRRVPDVRRMLENSDLVFAFCDGNQELAAFARVLTDYVYKAFVFDVIVRPDCRGSGLGRRLMNAILHHPDLQRVGHIELYCLPEMVPYYRKWGFKDDLGRVRLMRRTWPAAG